MIIITQEKEFFFLSKLNYIIKNFSSFSFLQLRLHLDSKKKSFVTFLSSVKAILTFARKFIA